MVVYNKLGDVNDDVAKIQRWLYQMWKSDPSKYPNPGTNWGTFDAATANAVKAFQRRFGIPATGVWDAAAMGKAREVTKFATKGRQQIPWDSNQGPGVDRAYIIKEFNRVWDRNPTEAELARHLDTLQRGQKREVWQANLERQNPRGGVTKLFEEIMGRAPTEAELIKYGGLLSNGRTNRLKLQQTLAALPEALLREQTTAATADQENARDLINQFLNDVDLPELADWAWEQIQQDRSPARIELELRKTPEWQTRYAGIVQRTAAGLPAISEADYLDYEVQAEQVMRTNGLPPGMASRALYADLVGGNVSIVELRDRIEEGYVRVQQAPEAIRAQFAAYYGADGDSALASYFLDKDRAIPLLQQMVRSAEVGGWGQTFDIGLAQARAEQIAQTGVDGEEAQRGFQQIQQLDPLFAETVSETLDLTKAGEGADAVFSLGGDGANQLERRAKERSAATSGGGGANVNQQGVGVGAAQ